MRSVSTPSNEGYFSSSSDDPQEETKKPSRPALRIKRKQDKLKKKRQQDTGLDQIIKKIEDEHIKLQEKLTINQPTQPEDKQIQIKGAERNIK